METQVPDALTQVLDANEHLLWWGIPGQGVILRAQDIFLIPFTFVWALFSIVTWIGILSAHPPLIALLPSTIFVGVGAYMTLGRFWIDARRRARTLYAVTSRRIVVIGAREQSSIELDNLGETRLVRSKDGTGSIYFGPDNGWFGRSWSWTGKPASSAFEKIDDVDVVYAGIRKARQLSGA